MIFNPGHFWLITLNVLGWLVIHLGVSLACSKIPLKNFNPSKWPYIIKEFEKNDRFYLKFFRIKKWKDYLPDGAKIFKGGFPKKELQSHDRGYLETFMLETCRAELTHWLQILPAPVFFIWNPWWAGLIMIVYALCANIPCILLQRYNRARLLNVL